MKIATLNGPLSIALELSGDHLVPSSRYHQARPRFWTEQRPLNIGDWFINDATLRLLDFDSLFVVNASAGPDAWEVVNEQCDAFVLKGGNYLFPGGVLSTHLTPDVLSRIRIPIILLGTGLQAGPGEPGDLGPSDLDSLRILQERSAGIAVRGQASADLLARHGIHDTVVTGCPTLFWQRGTALRVREPSRQIGRAHV